MTEEQEDDVSVEAMKVVGQMGMPLINMLQRHNMSQEFADDVVASFLAHWATVSRAAMLHAGIDPEVVGTVEDRIEIIANAAMDCIDFAMRMHEAPEAKQ